MKVGDEVRAFHPRMMGVVKHGKVVGWGPPGAAYVKVDFGALLGGVQRVSLKDVLPEVDGHARRGHGFRRGL